MTARSAKTAQGPNCQTAFQKMARRYVRALRKYRAAACRGDPDAIHELRIALTRLRGARKFFGAMTRDDAWPKLNAEIDWLNTVLGAARDDDVTTADADGSDLSSLAPEARQRLARATARSHRRLATALRAARCERLLAALTRWIDRGPWLTMTEATATRRRTQRLADFAPKRLQRWRQRLARKATHGLRDGRRRHRLRIAARRYRYLREALNVLGLPEDRDARRDRKAAQCVQRALGELRDLDRLRELQPARCASVNRRQQKRLRRKARNALRELG